MSPSVAGARVFLSGTVAAMIYGEEESESDKSVRDGDCFAPGEVWKDGSLNWELLSVPVPPPQNIGTEFGIYIDAARHLRRVARACARFLRMQKARNLLSNQVGSYIRLCLGGWHTNKHLPIFGSR